MSNTSVPIELSSTPGIVDNSNATAITIDSNENVGIGTSSPLTTLQVGTTGISSISGAFSAHQAVDGDAVHYFFNSTQATASSTNETCQLYLGWRDAASGIGVAPRIVAGKEGDYTTAGGADSFLAFHTTLDNTLGEKVRITSAGNVGIGTSSPSSTLTVNGTIEVLKDDINSAAEGGQITLRSPSGSTTKKRYNLDTYNASGESVFRLVGEDDADGANGAVHMSVNPSGNVGIGTSSPANLLHIKKTGFTRGTFEADGDNQAGIQIKRSNSSNNTDWEIYSPSSDTDLRFYNGGDKLTLDTSGRVGIGTSSPGNLLHIYESGSGQATIEIDNPQSGGATVISKQGSSAYGANAVGNACFYTYDNDISIMADGGAGNTSSIKFSTGGYALRMRIQSDGHLYFNQDRLAIFDANATWGVGLKIGAGASNTQDSTHAAIGPTNGNLHYDVREGSGYSHYFNWYGGTGGVAVIAGNGASGYGSMQASAFSVVSDYRIKTDITPLESSWIRIKQLNPIRFRYLPESLMPTENIVDGFLAHELQEIVPEAVIGEKDAVDEEGNDKHQTLDIGKLVPLLTAGLKDAIIKIEDLEVRLSAAQETISQLDSRIQALEE